MIFSRIKNQQHSTEILPFLFSKLFERAAYYGIFSVIFPYLLLSRNTIESDEIGSYYLMFINLSFLFMLIGALLGDLVIGNKKIMLLGGLLMTFGILLFMNPEKLYLIIGYIFIAIGKGLYAPNLLSGFSKQLFNKKKMLDSSFLMLFLIINIGGFIGPILISFLRNNDNYTYSLLMAAILMLVSVIFSYFTKEKKITKQTKYISSNFNIAIVFLSIIIVGVSWYLISGYIINASMIKIDYEGNSTFRLVGDFILKNLYAQLSILFSIVLSIIFTFYYTNRYLKIIIGFVFMLLSMFIILTLPKHLTKNSILIISISFALMSLAELLITPIFYGIISKLGNPKYYATFFALIYLPFNILNLVIGDKYYNTVEGMHRFINYSLVIIIAIIFIYTYIYWKTKEKLSSQNL